MEEVRGGMVLLFSVACHFDSELLSSSTPVAAQVVST